MLEHSRRAVTVTVMLVAGAACAQEKLPRPISLAAPPRALAFEPNRGQLDPRVRFAARGPGYSVALQSDGALLLTMRHVAGNAQTIGLRPVRAGAAPSVRGVDRLPGERDYYAGRDPARWITHVPTFAGVGYAHVYRDVRLVYRGAARGLEYVFEAEPGADVRAIELAVTGARGLRIDQQGGLRITLADGSELRQSAPVLYQEIDGKQRIVSGGFDVRAPDRIGFRVGAYDRSRRLVIDPDLELSTYLGGAGGDSGAKGVLDCDGNLYLTGSTSNGDFPGSTSSAQGGNVFVTKLDRNDRHVIFTAILGAGGASGGAAIALDPEGRIYVSGSTSSTQYPVSAGAYQTSFNATSGFGDAFFTVLRRDGAGLIYSTYLGGQFDNGAGSLAVASDHHVYLSGDTESDNFPTTPGSYDPQPISVGDPHHQGPLRGWIAEFDPFRSGAASLLHSSYIGAVQIRMQGMVLDDAGHPYALGNQDGTLLGLSGAPCGAPATIGAFVVAFDRSLSSIRSLSCLGNARLEANGLAIDGDDLFVSGIADSDPFTLTPNALQTVPPPNGSFIMRYDISHTLPTVAYASYLGGTGSDWPMVVAGAGHHEVWLSGFTTSTDFPLARPIQDHLGGGVQDAFVTYLRADGSPLLFSSYFGGSGSESGAGIVVDGSRRGAAFIMGNTDSSDLVTTPGAIQPTYGGNGDVFLIEITHAGH